MTRGSPPWHLAVGVLVLAVRVVIAVAVVSRKGSESGSSARTTQAVR